MKLPFRHRTEPRGFEGALGDAIESALGEKLRLAARELEQQGVYPDAPAYECPTCEDRGVITYAVPVGHEAFGRLYPCPDCQKGADIQAAQWLTRLKTSGLPAGYQSFTFDSWRALPETYREGKRLAFQAASLFAEHMTCMVSLAQAYGFCGRKWHGDDVVRNALVFQGAPGLGKTGLAAAIANELLRRARPVLYVRVQDFIGDVQARYGQDELPTAEDVIDTARRAPVLILDEMNMATKSDNRQEIMENVIRYRYGNALPLVVTCNSTQGELAIQWGERTTNVLFAMAHWIPLGGRVIRDVRKPTEVF